MESQDLKEPTHTMEPGTALETSSTVPDTGAAQASADPMGFKVSSLETLAIATPPLQNPKSRKRRLL